MAPPTLCYSQRSEVGVTGGVSFYMGDLNPGGVFKKLFYRYNFHEHWALRGSATIGWVKADADSGALSGRNLSFLRWSWTLLSLRIQFFRYAPGDMKRPITPYIFGGIALFNSIQRLN